MSTTPCETPRFLADAMLGGLARWLRVLGYDTVAAAHPSDADLVRQARQEGRILLTRDRALLAEKRPSQVLLIESTNPLVQLRQVVSHYGLPWQARLFSRCLRCNALLQPVPSHEVQSQVPAYVCQHQRRFMRCPACGRIYWEGSHVQHMRDQLHGALGPFEADAPPEPAS